MIKQYGHGGFILFRSGWMARSVGEGEGMGSIFIRWTWWVGGWVVCWVGLSWLEERRGEGGVDGVVDGVVLAENSPSRESNKR